MKTRIVFMLLLVALLISSFACKKKTDDTQPGDDIAAAIVSFAPLPSFKTVYEVLDHLNVKDISSAVPHELYKTKQEEMRNAFSLGVLTADAILAARGRNSAKLKDISSQMLSLTGLLGLDNELSQMGDELKGLIEKQEWDKLDDALDHYKKSVEDILFEKENFDNYTLMILGGWMEAANRVAWLVSQNYSEEYSRVLGQKGTFNSLVGNMKEIDTEHYTEQEAFKTSLKHLIALQEIISSDIEGSYNKNQLTTIIEGTSDIKKAFQK
ncbi:MAG: hypothetical protein PHC50_06815 [Candidatus Cloacimonetes bacterium]|nr:hypothetical protein [Candidatus Cloacimonadota bacterium]